MTLSTTGLIARRSTSVSAPCTARVCVACAPALTSLRFFYQTARLASLVRVNGMSIVRQAGKDSWKKVVQRIEEAIGADRISDPPGYQM